jgi:hypothetical protein
MLKLMSFVKLLTCGNLHTTLIVHATIKFVVPILHVLMFVAKLLLNYFLEVPRCGKALCARKVNLSNGTNVNVCLVNVTSAVLMCYLYVPRKLRDLMIGWWLGGDSPFNKLCQ